MKRAILPVGFAILMIVIAMTVNSDAGAVAVALAGFIGIGIGIALNSLIFKTKKSTEKEETDTK